MKRRDFISLLGGAAVAWPIAARAQQRERMRRIGLLINLAADDPESQARLAAFAQGLQQAGWTVGQNIRIDYRFAAGSPDSIRSAAEELVGLGPDVLIAHGATALRALQRATRTIPIVFGKSIHDDEVRRLNEAAH